MKLIKNHKQISDNIHGPISISNYACRIIDKHEFERLRYLHQLGTCYYVFPSATHTRFEHSIGTYFLTGWIIDSIRNNSSEVHVNNCLAGVVELKSYFDRTYGNVVHYKLDDYVCELIKFAGLCHDLGHGPFSHLFDDVFIPIMSDGGETHPYHFHENRSCAILEMIIKRDDELSKLITDPEIQFIKNLINPQKDHTGFIYQIVSNNLNAIDVDKFDYLIRDTTNLGLKFGFDYKRLLNDAKVIDNIICYPEQMYNEVSAIFDTRYKLHKQVYTHKVVISTQYMINDMMLMMEPIIHMYDCINDMNKFYKLTDNYVIEAIKFFEHFKDELLNEEGRLLIDKVFKIWVDLNERRMYKFIGSIVSKIDKNITLDAIHSIDPSIDVNDVVLHKSKIGFVSGSKGNPFDELYFYNNKHPNVCLKIKKEKVTFLISDTYQEYIYMFFVKDNKNQELIEKFGAVFRSFE